MVKGKTLQIPSGPDLITKLAKAQKELKASSMAECGRMLLEFTLENDISSLRERVKKAELEKRQRYVADQLQKWQEQNTVLEQEMEKLNA